MLRVMAVITLVLLGFYHVLRLLASGCSGARCDAYVLPSVLVPLLILLAVAVTTGLGLWASRRDHSWFSGLALVGCLGVFGPLLALVLLRDHPDAVVVVATLLFALVPVVSLVYSVWSA